MNAQILFKTDRELKEASMKKARKEGLPLSAVLNLALEAYVTNRLAIVAFDRDLALARQDGGYTPKKRGKVSKRR